MKPKKWELVLVLFLAAALCLWAFLPRHRGGMVTVSVDGSQVGSYALEENSSHPVSGYGGFTLTLVIDGGEAHVEESSCPDLICQHHAPISKIGEQIVCLPGRVVISITGTDGKEAAIDAITG